MYSKYPLSILISVDNDNEGEEITLRKKTILATLRSTPHGLSSSQIGKEVEFSERTIRRELKKLSELGFVKSKGEGRALRWFF